MKEFLQVRQHLYNQYNIILNESTQLTHSLMEDIYSAICDLGYKEIPFNFSQIKNKSRSSYDKSGWKVTHSLLQLKRERGGRIHSVIVEMGIRELYSRQTADLARMLLANLFPGIPHYAKIERTNAKESHVHIHVTALLPRSFKFPKDVNGFRVLNRRLGRGEYKGQSIKEAVTRFIRYLGKPADARADRSNLENRKMMYAEWVLEMNARTYGRGNWDMKVRMKWHSNLDNAYKRYDANSHIRGTTPKPKPVSKKVNRTYPTSPNSETLFKNKLRKPSYLSPVRVEATQPQLTQRILEYERTYSAVTESIRVTSQSLRYDRDSNYRGTYSRERQRTYQTEVTSTLSKRMPNY